MPTMSKGMGALTINELVYDASSANTPSSSFKDVIGRGAISTGLTKYSLTLGVYVGKCDVIVV